MLIAQIAVGAAFGNIAFLGYFFKYIKNEKTKIICKSIFSIGVSFIFAIVGIATGWQESIYIAS